MSLTRGSHFYNFTGTTSQAQELLDRVLNIRDLSIGRSQRSADLKYILHQHVHQKRGEETAFIVHLSCLYGLTKLRTARGFPAELNKRAYNHLSVLRPSLHLRYEFRINEYEHSDWAQSPGRREVVDPTKEADRVRRRELSMMVGIIVAVLKQYDGWKERVRVRQAGRGGALTNQEDRELQQIFEDLFSWSRNLLGPLAEAIDEAQENGL